MKRMICLLLTVLAFTVMGQAAEVPEELTDALPDAAAELLENGDYTGVDGFSSGVFAVLEGIGKKTEEILRQRLKSVVAVLLVLVLCGLVENLWQVGEGKGKYLLPMAGALSITVLTAGGLDVLIGLGAETIDDLHRFSKVLLPALAAATAAAGGVTTASFQQMTTVFLSEVLMNLIDTLLMPLVYLYIGLLTAACCLPDNRLEPIAEYLKKAIIWILTTALLLFTVYLSIARVISGAVDASAVKVTKTAISGAVPVVGGIIAEAAETVLAGAGLLKNTIGIFGMLAILAACAYPFLQLGIQYLLYKLIAFLGAVIGTKELYKLVNGLGGAFGLVLGMTGSCALLLLISVLSCVAVINL